MQELIQELINVAPFTAFLIFLSVILMTALTIGLAWDGIYYSLKKNRDVRKAVAGFVQAGMFVALAGFVATDIYQTANLDQQVRAVQYSVDARSEAVE